MSCFLPLKKSLTFGPDITVAQKMVTSWLPAGVIFSQDGDRWFCFLCCPTHSIFINILCKFVQKKFWTWVNGGRITMIETKQLAESIKKMFSVCVRYSEKEIFLVKCISSSLGATTALSQNGLFPLLSGFIAVMTT